MKKIMFSDKFQLTKAVLEGRKTMTRRIVPENTPFGNWAETVKKSRYKVGEVVAVAQSLRDMGYDPRDTIHKSGAIWGLDHTPAWTNKMFVSASECKHYIRITDIRIERLLDISDDDCIKEGIQAVRIPDGWRYVAGGSKICESDRNRIWSGELKLSEKCAFNSPYAAFADLFDRVSGKGTFESNPWVFVYEFELIK